MSKEDFKQGSFWVDAIQKFGFPIVVSLWLMFSVSPKLDKLIELSQQTVALLQRTATTAQK